MKAIGIWQGGFQTLLEDSSGHSVTVDLPADEGGRDVGPFALELSVMSLSGCITTIFALVAKKRRLHFDRMVVELEAQRPKGAPTISSVEGILRITTSAPRAEVETALEITLRTCPVGVLYEKAQVPVRVRLEVHAPVALAAAANG
jgi:putative redox protein